MFWDFHLKQLMVSAAVATVIVMGAVLIVLLKFYGGDE